MPYNLLRVWSTCGGDKKKRKTREKGEISRAGRSMSSPHSQTPLPPRGWVDDLAAM